MSERMPDTQCEKPGCEKVTQVFGSRWCADCWYPGIDRDMEIYQGYRADGYSHYQASLNVGWADPHERDE